jgi:clan AA aspartic protease
MGLIYTEIELKNPRLPDQKAIKVRALADSGALMMCIPEHIALQLETVSSREVTVADGRSMVIPYAGPLLVSLLGRSCFTGALIMGDEVLLGAVSMEDLDLILHPASRTVTVNPDSPNIPHAKVK